MDYGGYLCFNPLSGLCDWPGRVIAIRPECSRGISSFPQHTFSYCARNFIKCLRITKSFKLGILLPVIKEKVMPNLRLHSRTSNMSSKSRQPKVKKRYILSLHNATNSSDNQKNANYLSKSSSTNNIISFENSNPEDDLLPKGPLLVFRQSMSRMQSGKSLNLREALTFKLSWKLVDVSPSWL
ncbi:unnamed protein product [Lepeophtheirus salmonis]|uniref:(salmon louse) hypothetical protein n=1 Tax=Lepeophtheirus salmonis TaxID=72036 RepID=A0A7R8CMC2_LEPSM|nr:unnamed protein product [Lepeophtheirus salmonis]CAF2830529.1 unnamed protein product [Lepeophtheirus salmonis]